MTVDRPTSGRVAIPTFNTGSTLDVRRSVSLVDLVIVIVVHWDLLNSTVVAVSLVSASQAGTGPILLL